MKILTAMLLALLTFTTISYAHESAGYEHQVGKSGMMVGQGPCGMSTMWYHDDTEDGEVNRCSQMMLVHGQVHVKDIPIVDGTCECPRGD